MNINSVLILLKDYKDRLSKKKLTYSVLGVKSSLETKLDLLFEYEEDLNLLEPGLSITSLEEEPYKDLLLEIKQLVEENPHLATNTFEVKQTSNLAKRQLLTLDQEYLPKLDSREGAIAFSLQGLSDIVLQQLNRYQVFALYGDSTTQQIGRGILTGIDLKKQLIKLEHLSFEETYTQDLVKYAVLTKWWNRRESYSLWTETTCFEPIDQEQEDNPLSCVLMAKLANFKMLYGIDWQLFYRTPDWEEPELFSEEEDDGYVLVAKGVDGVYPGYAYLAQMNSLFKPGAYKLTGKVAYSKDYSLRTYEVNWNIETTTNKLIHE